MTIVIDSAWKDWYRAKHNQECDSHGEAFESYVTKVLTRFHDDYINPEAMGSQGDGGCDGLADKGAVLYACYGQRATTGIDQKTKQKLESDFARALNNWPEFTEWRFITNAPFGPTPTKCLETLRNQHGPNSQRPLTLTRWTAPEDLWWKVVNKLSFSQLDEVMPGVPHAQNVELRDLVDLIEALEVSEDEEADTLQQIPSVPPTKMDYNQLPTTTRTEFNEGRLLSPRIDNWFAGQADPTLRDAKAKRFRSIYEEAKKVTNEPYEIVSRIYIALGGSDFIKYKKRANAVYAITVYFFDSCDIFEEPPNEYPEGGPSHVTSN